MQKSLLSDIQDDTCLFDDIHGIFANPDTHHQDLLTIPMFREKLVHVWSLGLQTGARCVNHHRMCPWIHLGLPRIGGPPCQDWSSAGNKRGVNGPQLPTLISMGRKSAACYDAVCIVENSPNMPDWVPQSCWPTWFSWVSAIVDPSDVGYDFLARIFS